jgi:hypothetical protein
VGAPRIHGELLMLGFAVADRPSANTCRRRRRPPSQGWKTFLRNHLMGVASLDLFVVRAGSFTARSRPRLWFGIYPASARDGHPQPSRRGALALAEWPRRTLDRINQAVMSRPRHGVRCEAHLRRVLKSYAAYYNQVRTHLALDKDAPHSRPRQRIGQAVVALPSLGGLHHEYLQV